MPKPTLQYDMLRGVARKLVELKPEASEEGWNMVRTPQHIFMVGVLSSTGLETASITMPSISVRQQSLQECHGGAGQQDDPCRVRQRRKVHVLHTEGGGYCRVPVIFDLTSHCSLQRNRRGFNGSNIRRFITSPWFAAYLVRYGIFHVKHLILADESLDFGRSMVPWNGDDPQHVGAIDALTFVMGLEGGYIVFRVADSLSIHVFFRRRVGAVFVPGGGSPTR
jgi:hypothetical protein